MSGWARLSKPVSSLASSPAEESARNRRGLPAVHAAPVARRTGARFGLRFEIFDKDYVQRMSAASAGSASTHGHAHSRFLISQRLLIDESYTGAAARLAWRLSDPGTLLDPGRSPPRGPIERPAICHRLPNHPGHPRPRAALRTSSVPFRDAAQWPLEQFLGSAGDPRPAAILPRR